MGGVVPTPINSSAVIIDHAVIISATLPVEHMQVLIRGDLSIAAGSSFTLSPGSLEIQGSGTLSVYGIFIFSDGASMTGNTSSNTHFFNGSEFRYASRSITEIPLATWDIESTINVNNIMGNASITLGSWIQEFGNFIYDCPAQGAFMDFNGRIRNVRGNLIIRNTNKNILRFARGHVLTLNVGRDLVIEGPSEVWFGETGENLLINVGGSFRFRSTSTAASYLSLSGTIRVDIGGDLELNTSYKLKCTSSSGKSATINLNGNLNFLTGTIDALGSGNATINFIGNKKQLFTRRAGTLFDGNIHFTVENSSTLDLGTSCLTNTNGGSLVVKGRMQLGVLHSDGVIQNNESGNLWFTGPVNFENGAILELNGTGAQHISEMIPDRDTHLMINNVHGVRCNRELAVGSLSVTTGELDHGTNNVLVNGNLTVESGAAISGNGEILFDSDAEQLVNANSNALKNITISGSPHIVRLVTPLRLTGVLRFSGPEGELISDDKLILSSSSTSGENSGAIAPLGPLHRVSGNVTVERFVDAGRLYRYISSPVQNATVEDLQRSFAVTGTFNDPSVGPGINSVNPSLFFYDEPSAQWINYPGSGYARDHMLHAGKGYAAFLRSLTDPVLIKWQGPINSGSLDYNVTYTDSASGWNLVGNPYPSPVSWDNPGWMKVNMSNSIAVRDNVLGTFRFWNGSVGSLTNGVISTGQAFWVLATAADPRLEITEETKALVVAPFYRESSPDFIKISLTDGENADTAFVQIDRRAKAVFDRFDALKLANDHLDLAILSQDGKRLAISAVPDASCVMRVPLYFRNANKMRRSGVLAVTSSLSMEGATYRLVNDRDDTTLESAGNEFTVPLDEGESDKWILEIRFTQPLSPKLLYDPYVCETSPATITVTNVTPGVRYNLFQELSHGQAKSIAEGDRFSVAFTDLGPSHSFFVQATNFCGMSQTALELTPKTLSAPKVTDNRRCGPGELILNAAGADDSQAYHWFDFSGREIGIGNAFNTGNIAETTEFFVAIRDSVSNCFSERTSVYAHIEKRDSIAISLRTDTLFTTGTSGTLTWFLDGKILENSNDWYLPHEDGEYKVIAANGSCVSTVSIKFSGTKNLKKQVRVFPNPATSEVVFAFNQDDDVILNDIINSNGISVFYLCNRYCTNTCCILDIRSLVNGTYLLLFISGDKHKTIRLSVLR